MHSGRSLPISEGMAYLPILPKDAHDNYTQSIRTISSARVERVLEEAGFKIEISRSV